MKSIALLAVVSLFSSCTTASRSVQRNIPSATSHQAPSSQIVFSSATELARRIRAGKLTSTEVVRAFVAQIAGHDAKYNAVVLLDEKNAMARAADADAALARGEVWGPLHGVPVAIKDTFSTRGLRTTAGHESLAEYVPEHDATVVALLKEAGAIVLAKVNTAALAMDMQTDNALFGRTVNPWDPERTPGGSSGGCAVALATGMSPLCFGSDLAGSIRLPSGYTGVVGLKPTFGAVSMKGHIPPRPGELSGVRRSLAVPGPMARSIEDLELALTVVAQPHSSDRRIQPLRPLSKPPRGLRSLRVAYLREPGGIPVSRSVGLALDAFVQRLRAAGATVVEAQPEGFDYQRTWEIWGKLVGMQGGYDRSNLARWFGNLFAGGKVEDVPHLRHVLEPISLSRYMETLDEQDAQIDALEGFLAGHDAWIVPVSPTPALRHTQPDQTFGDFNVYDAKVPVDDGFLPYYVATQALTTLFSVTESPVVSLPVGLTSEGLPVGVQVVGRRFDDMNLLRVSALLASVVEPLRYPLKTGRAK